MNNDEMKGRIIDAIGEAYKVFNENFVKDQVNGIQVKECCYQTASNIFKGAIYTARDTK